MRLLWAILVLFSLGNIAHGQTPSEAEPTVEELLRQVKNKKDLSVQEISQLPNLVEGEVGRTMTKLDNLFREQMSDRFDEHYKEVEQSLLAVSLPENVSSWKVAGEGLKAVLEAGLEVVWKQRKVGDDSGALTSLIEGFSHRAQTALELHRRKLGEGIDVQLEETRTAELKQAQDTIRASFQEILRQHLPVWDVPNLCAPPLSGIQKEGRSNVQAPPIPSFQRISPHGRIVKRIARKVASKVLVKFISLPFGWALPMGYVLWDVTWAKANLEHELQEQFLNRYKEKVSPTTVWDQPAEEGSPSTRRRLEQEVSKFLRDWAKHCRKEVEQILGVADVSVLSPNVQDYIAEQTEKGHDTRKIVEDMVRAREMFGYATIVQYSLGDLLTMIDRAPDKQELARFADVGPCGVQLWDIYIGSTTDPYQREKAENAIYLLKEDYPCDILQTPEGLAEIQLYHRLTFGLAPKAFQMAGPFWKIIYAGATVLIILLIAVPAVRLLRKLG